MIAVVAGAGSARAEPAHTAYVELFGKGGLYGAGYDYAVHPRLAVGATTSLGFGGGQRTFTIAPYAAVYPARAGAHGWFVHAGPALAHVSTPSPVPEWSGDRRTGLGAHAASGYEYRGRRLVVRSFVMATAGRGGLSPWAGASLGVRF